MPKLYYKGDIIFLYVKFLDSNQQPVKNIKNACVRILHEKCDKIYEDLNWTKMFSLSENEYFYNFQIGEDMDCGLYDVIYSGEVDNKSAVIMENFHIINKSMNDLNVIKIYGYINDIMKSSPIDNVKVIINNKDLNYETQSYTIENGYWESYIYPGEYNFIFKKHGFKSIEMDVQIGNDNTEIQFDNIVLESLNNGKKGKGIYRINDKCVNKFGIGLNGLVVNIYSVFMPTVIIATDITNNNGEWEAFLDPGAYLLKIIGNSMNTKFNKTFRLIIDDLGKYNIDNIDGNTAIISDNNFLNNGNGSSKFTDIVTTSNGTPIPDVQILVYISKSCNEAIAECYTDINGNWELYLNPGEYYIKYYHPRFKDTEPQKINVI